VTENELPDPPAENRPGPLAGIRVLDVSTVLAGPMAAQWLGDFGADVIKVEHPKFVDSLRTHGASVDGVSLWWKVIGRHKRCLGLYLGDPEAAKVFLRLVETADVLIENFRPGTLERWGLGPDVLHEVNPRLVLVRISGYGQTGPYASRPGFGTLAEAMSGFAAMTGEPDGPPTLPPFGLADGIAGITAVGAISMALYARDTGDGRGQVVDLSILEPLVSVLGPQATVHHATGAVPPRTGNRSNNNAPRNTYLSRDGSWIALSTSANSIAERVLVLVGHPEVVGEPWFASGSGRAEHADLLDGWVADWIAQRDAANVLSAFAEANVAAAPVLDIAGLMDDPQVRAREVFVSVPDDELGEVLMQDVPVRLSRTPGAAGEPGRPAYADTDAILIGELGLDASLVAALRERGICA
jgi:crotonobetainyl-CoA:carnitine CoA-transferase CaiB-like acyl-CoA transferase